MEIYKSGKSKWRHLVYLLGFVFVFLSITRLVADTASKVALTIEERSWLDQNPEKLILWFNTDFPPIEFVDETGHFLGMGADVIALVEQQLGIRFIKQASSNWNEHLAALKSGECAVAPAIVATPEREKYAQFTAPYASSSLVIIAANSVNHELKLSRLGGLRIAVVSGFASEGYLQEHAQQDFDLIPMPDVAHALRATSFGQVDAYVENMAVAAYFIQKEGIPNLRVAGETPYRFAWRIGISRQYPLLASAIVKAVSAIPAEKLENARGKWIAFNGQRRLSPETARLLILILIFVVLLVLGLLVISFILKKQLKEKIAGLEDARNKILEQTEFIRFATETTQAGFWDVQLKEGVIFFSKQWFNMLGYDQEGELLKLESIREFVHPDDLSKVTNRFGENAVTDNLGFSEVEIRLKKADGSWCWILSKEKPVTVDENGEASRIIGLDINIQKLKEAQEEVRQSEMKFRTIFDSAPYAIVINDFETGLVVEANQVFISTNHIESLDELHRLPSRGLSSMGKTEAERVMKQLSETGRIDSYETETIHKDGSHRQIVFSSSLIEYAGRKQIISIILDITEQKKAEDELRLSEERFKELFISAPIPLVLLTTDGKIVSLNNAMIHTFGYLLEDIPDLDHWWSHAYPDPEYRNQVRTAWEGHVRKAMADNTPVKPQEYRVVSKNGRRLRVRFNTSIMGDLVIISLYEITDIREKEAALQETMERLRATLNATSDGILVVDTDMKIVQSNQQFYQMWHVPPELQATDDDMAIRQYVKDQLVDPWDFFNKTVELYASRSHEMFEILFKDGRVFECNSAQMFVAGEVTGRVWDFRDITERKKAEDAINFERKKLKSIFSAMNDVILICDVQGNLIEIVKTKADLIQKSFGDVHGKNPWDIFPHDKASELMRAMENSITLNIPVSLDFSVRIGDQAFWFAATVSPMPPDRVVWVARDITSRRLAVEQLEQSEERFSKIFAMAPNLVAITRMEDGKFIDINDGFEEITGWRKDEVVGLTSTDIHFWVEPSDRSVFVEVLKSGRHLINQEVTFRRKDGALRMGLYSALSINLAEEMSLLSVIQDITEIKKNEEERLRLQQQLSQAQKLEAIGILAGGVAHDFNNILGAIIGYAELALAEIEDTNPLKETLNIILDAAQRSASLTRQLLAFARKEVVEPIVIDINKAIEDILKMLQRLIGENIELRWVPGRESLKVILDPSQLDQILANLCVNARDAIGDIGTIIIETELKIIDEGACTFHPECIPGEYVQLTVSDNGAGMDADTLDHVFEPFFTTKGLGRGTGLGLSTVYGIIRQNKGFVKVYSEPGKGTAFNVFLPREAGDAKQKRSGSSKIEMSRGETILLVEDDEILLKMTQLMLQRLQYNVLVAANPSMALRIVAEYSGEIHMFLTDVVMPEMTGRELAEKLQEIRPGIQHLFMSGYTADVIAHQGVLNDGVNFIHKPFSLQRLSDKIKSILER